MSSHVPSGDQHWSQLCSRKNQEHIDLHSNQSARWTLRLFIFIILSYREVFSRAIFNIELGCPWEFQHFILVSQTSIFYLHLPLTLKKLFTWKSIQLGEYVINYYFNISKLCDIFPSEIHDKIWLNLWWWKWWMIGEMMSGLWKVNEHADELMKGCNDVKMNIHIK